MNLVHTTALVQTARTFLTGNAVITGAATTVFTFPHGMATTPAFVSVMPRNSLSSALFSINWNATNVIVTYLTAITGSVSLGWQANN
jgi:hypothetical protein